MKVLPNLQWCKALLRLLALKSMALLSVLPQLMILSLLSYMSVILIGECNQAFDKRDLALELALEII